MGKKSRNKKLKLKDSKSDLVLAANSQEDPLSNFLPFRKFERNGLHASLSCHRASSLPPSTLHHLLQLTKRNMQQFYEESGWGWDEGKKMGELSHSDAWILVIKDASKDTKNSQESQNGCHDNSKDSENSVAKEADKVTCDKQCIAMEKEVAKENTDVPMVTTKDHECVQDTEDEVVGFAHFRFDIDYGVEVLYCYELQLRAGAQGRGLGRFVMALLQLIAFKSRMTKVVLTVLKCNQGASKFYHSLKYTQDESSPNIGGHDDDPNIGGHDHDPCYEILSKYIAYK